MKTKPRKGGAEPEQAGANSGEGTPASTSSTGGGESRIRFNASRREEGMKPRPKAENGSQGHPSPRNRRFDDGWIAHTQKCPPETAAAALDARAREIGDELSRSDLFTELGIIVQEVERRELWKFCHANDGEKFCHSFDHWMNEALWCSASWGYAAKSVAEHCDDIPVEVRRRIPPKTLLRLRGASPRVRQDPEVQERAQTVKPAEFLRDLETNHPDQHIEAEEPYKFSPSTSQRERIDEAMLLCLKLGDAHNREEVLECWAQTYVEENAYRLGEQTVVGKVKRKPEARIQ